jgi:hypothetical protein
MAKKKKRDIVAEAKRIAAENLEYQRQHFPGKISRGRTEHYYAPPPEKRPPAMRERMAKEESARRRVETRLREFEPKKKPTTQKKPAKTHADRGGAGRGHQAPSSPHPPQAGLPAWGPGNTVRERSSGSYSVDAGAVRGSLPLSPAPSGAS